MSAREQLIQLQLTPDEALVLFEWIHRHEDAGYGDLEFEDPGERIALENLSASLEKVVDVVFSSTYAEELSAARHRLAPRA